MNNIHLQIIRVVLFFLFIFLSGSWLKKSGKPYNGIFLTIHKLISLAAVVFFVITIQRRSQASALSAVELTALVVAGLLFLGTMITGAMLSVRKPMPAAIFKLHRITPYLTVFSAAVAMYLLTCCKL
jgi:hypothetical protein